MAHISSTNLTKLHNNQIEMCIPTMSISREHMATLIETESTLYIDLAEKSYRFRKTYISGEEHNMEIFQPSSGVRNGGNEILILFNIFFE